MQNVTIDIAVPTVTSTSDFTVSLDTVAGIGVPGIPGPKGDPGIPGIGIQGPKGDSGQVQGFSISEYAPSSPAINDVWIKV